MQICYNDKMEVRSKIWLAVDGEAVFGSGREALFKAIDRLGRSGKWSNDEYRVIDEAIRNCGT